MINKLYCFLLVNVYVHHNPMINLFITDLPNSSSLMPRKFSSNWLILSNASCTISLGYKRWEELIKNKDNWDNRINICFDNFYINFLAHIVKFFLVLKANKIIKCQITSNEKLICNSTKNCYALQLKYYRLREL